MIKSGSIGKKLICTILGLLLLLNISVCAGAMTGSNYDKEIEVLTKLGIVEGKAQNFSPYSKVTKLQFADMVLKMLNIQATSLSENQIFYDVPVTHEYFSVAETAYSLGIINGIGAGLLGGNSEISVNQALTILLRSINQDEFAETKGGYPAGYGIVGDDLGITSGVSYSERITIGEACRLVFNTLKCDAKGKGYSDSKSYFATIHNVYSAKGNLTRNRYIELPDGNGTGDNTVIISGTEFDAGTTNAHDFVGCPVNLYYKHDEGRDIRTILWIQPLSIVNTMVLRSSDCLEISPQEIICNTDNTSEEHFDVSPLVQTVYNNAVYRFVDNIPVPDTGYITATDIDGDDIYDIINIIDYQSYMVSNVNVEKNTIYSLTNTNDIICLDDYDDVKIKNPEGDLLAISDITANTMLNIAKNESETFLEIVVCGGKSQITADEVIIDTFSSGSDKVIIKDMAANKTYTVNGSVKKLQPSLSFKVGGNYSVYFNLFGDIAYVESDVFNEEMRFGYLLAWSDKNSGIDDTCSFRILTKNEGIKNYKAKKKVQNENYVNVTAKSIVQGLENPTVIMFSTDSQGLIDKLHLPKETGSTGFRESGIAGTGDDSRFYKASMTIGGKILVEDSTIVFGIPDDITNESQYICGLAKDLIKDNTYYAGAYSYTARDNSFISDVVVIKWDNIYSIGAYSNMLVFEKFVEGYDEDTEEYITMVQGYLSGKRVKLRLNEVVNTSYKVDNISYDLEHGDVFRYLQNDKNEIVKMNVLYSNKLNKIISNKVAGSVGYAAVERYVTGIPYQKKGKAFTIIPEGSTQASSDIYVYQSNSVLYEYDSSKPLDKRITPISIDDMVTKYDDNMENSKIFINTYYSQTRLMIIYK